MKNQVCLPALAAFCIGAAACSPKAEVKGMLTGAPDTQIVVKQLTTSSNDVIDTIKTASDGSYSYRLEVREGEPEFVYFYKGETKLASVLLEKGDRVKVVSDTLGNYSVEGSEESLKLQQIERDFSDFMQRFGDALEAGDNPFASRQYIEYYRSRVIYVMENRKSITTIPVLYQKINPDFPVFSQSTDAIHFKNAYDSLLTVYPASRYVKALGQEADRRFRLLNLSQRISEAPEMSYPELELPSIDGSKVRLGSLDAKVILVYFWSAADAAQKMFNQDVLLPVYNAYHPRGFEIYAVSLDIDKGTWASAVNNQKLPWINVCDGLGPASRAAVLYNIGNQLPVSFMIVNGSLVDATIQGEASLRKFLDSNL
jgi:hypothetical protein